MTEGSPVDELSGHAEGPWPPLPDDEDDEIPFWEDALMTNTNPAPKRNTWGSKKRCSNLLAEELPERFERIARLRNRAKSALVEQALDRPEKYSITDKALRGGAHYVTASDGRTGALRGGSAETSWWTVDLAKDHLRQRLVVRDRIRSGYEPEHPSGEVTEVQAPPKSAGDTEDAKRAQVAYPEEELWSIKAVVARTGLSKSTIYSYVEQGLFPRQRRLGLRRVGWLASEVGAWIKTRPI